jgi:glycosyltransferase involved in cell wall biosynthesis
MKKILFIHHAKGWGGAPNSLIKLINGLDKSTFDIEVLLLKESIVADKLKENGIKYHIAKSWFYRKYYHYFTHSEAGYLKWYQIYSFLKKMIFWLLSYNYFAARELSRFDFDICHLNSSVLTDWLKPCSKKGKVVIHIREPFRKGKFDILHPFFVAKMRKYADCIIAISQDNAMRIDIPEKTKIIYNYADTPEDSPDDYSYKSRKVLYLGGAAKIKGFYTLVEALDYLKEGIQVYFAGYYPSPKILKGNIVAKIYSLFKVGEKKVKALNKMRGHTKAVEIGMISNVHQYLNDSCCLVSAFSIPHFARPVIEAHLHRKPVIVTDVKGMSEIVQDNINGLIVPNHDSAALGMAINQLTSDFKQAKMLGVNGYNVAISKFSPKNVKHFKNIYLELLSENSY